MPTLYLHIGTPKTGTSAIQITLGTNAEILKKQNVVFPDFGLRYANAAKYRNAHFLIEEDDPEAKDYALALSKIIELSKTYETIVLSEENLWRQEKRLDKFREDLNAQGIQLKVIVYFRRQDLYLQSQYAQHVKVYLKDTFEEYVKSQDMLLDYYSRIQVFVEQIGKDNIIVRVYEKAQFLNQNLITDFLHVIGITDSEEFAEPKEANTSLSGIYLETKRLLNRTAAFQTKDNFVIRYLKSAASDAGKTASFSANHYFSYEKQMEFLAQFEESNQKIAREFLGREEGVLFTDKISTDIKPVQDAYTTEEYVDILAEIILKQKENIDVQNEKINSLNQKIKSQNTLISELKSPSGYAKHVIQYGKKKILSKLKGTTGK